jgi:hypothetical protein
MAATRFFAKDAVSMLEVIPKAVSMVLAFTGAEVDVLAAE